MTQPKVTYTPADPASVTEVSRLRLFTTEERTGAAIVDVGPAVRQPNGSWIFTLPEGTADGFYYAITTVTYIDATTVEDANDTISLPLDTAAQLGEPIALWVDPADLGSTQGEPERIAAARCATEVLYDLSGRRYPGPRVAHLNVPGTRRGHRELLPGALPWGPGPGRRGCGSCVTEFDPRLGPIRSVQRLSIGDVEVPAEQIETVGERAIRLRRGDVTDPLAVNLWSGPDGLYSLFPGGCGCDGPGIDIVFTWGRDVPAAGRAAALAFAKELAKYLTGDATCRLPGNVTSVSRQGVSIVLDPATFLDKGRTGVPLTDLWLMAVNPQRLQAEATFWDPSSPLPETVG